MKETQHYGLTQWEPWDRQFRERLAGDSGRLDQVLAGKAPAAETLAALATKCEVVAGSYVGDGRTRVIELGFYPVAVILNHRRGSTSNDPGTHGGLVVRGGKLYFLENTSALALTETGFRVTYSTTSYMYTNINNEKFYYIAFKSEG